MKHKSKIPVKHFFSLVKFSHTIFAMPFAIIGFFLAIELNHLSFDWQLFVLILLCMIFARNAAMGFNRYLDRDIDKLNQRTSKRELPSGIINARSALWFVIINILLFIFTTFFINRLVFFLSPIALIVVLGYSYTKRFTYLCHFILGIGLSLAPIGAYLAVKPSFDLLPVLYSFIVLFWVSGFDIMYALQDVQFDKEQQLKSIPVYTGKKTALWISIILHIISGLLVIFAGWYTNFGMFYWTGTIIFCGLLIYQHAIVKPDDLSRINLAFFTTNGIASVIFSIFVLLEILLN